MSLEEACVVYAESRLRGQWPRVPTPDGAFSTLQFAAFLVRFVRWCRTEPREISWS